MNKQTLLRMSGVGLLVVAVLGSVILVKTRPKAKRREMPSMIPVVEVMPLEVQNLSVSVECLGTVIADTAVELQAEVSGQIISTHPELDEGAFIREGELLLEIDPRDYELAVQRAESSLQSAKSDLRLEEGRQSVAKHEMELVGKDGEIDLAYQDLMLREPQRLAAAAAVRSVEATLKGAQLSLERTRIYAPFDAVVQSVNLDKGDFAQISRTLAELVAVNRFFVRVSIPVGALQWFPNMENIEYAARVMPDEAERKGWLYKLLPGISEKGQMARLLIAVDNPLAPGFSRPMLLNEVVQVQLIGKEEESVCLIDRKYLRGGLTIWMMDENRRLQICPVEVVQGYADQVMIRVEFSNDWRLVTSNIAAPVDGMELKTIADLNRRPQR
jgi:RND family efflux transporter MFP subunit